MGATTSVSANRFRIAISPNSHTTSEAIVARDSPRDCPLESSLCSTFTRLRPLLSNVFDQLRDQPGDHEDHHRRDDARQDPCDIEIVHTHDTSPLR